MHTSVSTFSNLNVRNFDRSWLFSTNGDETTWLTALQLLHRSLSAQSPCNGAVLQSYTFHASVKCMSCTTNKLLRYARSEVTLTYLSLVSHISSGNNNNVFRCSWQCYLIPINHEHPDISVSVSVPLQPAPCCLHITPVTTTSHLPAHRQACHWPTVTPGTLLGTERTHYLTLWIKVSTAIPTEAQVNHIYVYCYTAAVAVAVATEWYVTTEWHNSGLLMYFYILGLTYHMCTLYTNLLHSGDYMYQPIQLIPPVHLCVPHNSQTCNCTSLPSAALDWSACCFWRYAFINNSLSNTNRCTVCYRYMYCTVL
jgi:hypothetical protein